jgi:excisionase family DNA binding protein
MADEWITVREAARLSGYHIEHIRRLTRTGEVKARKFATVWQVNRKSLLTYLTRVKELGERRGPKPA